MLIIPHQKNTETMKSLTTNEILFCEVIAILLTAE